MQTFDLLTSYYVIGSLAISIIAVLVIVIVYLTYNDSLLQKLAILARLKWMVVFWLVTSSLGYLAGVFYMQTIQEPGVSTFSYQTFGGLGYSIGSPLGITLGWHYAFWPLLCSTNPSPRQQPTKRNPKQSQDEH
jgi:hypothetical protein